MSRKPSLDLKLDVQMKGRYKLQILREDGSCRFESDWFDNLITNQGLDQIGFNASPMNAPFGAGYLNSVCSLGTSTTTPQYTDTQLGAYGCASSPQNSGVWGATTAYNAGTTPYWSAIWTYTFSTGVATGTWSEIGVGNWYHSADTQPELFSHALIVSGGSPTTITVLSSESLIVTYELDYYINTTTNSYSMVISTVTYSGSYLRANITAAPQLFLGCGLSEFGNTSTYLNYYNGTIGTITGQPSGSGSSGPNNSTSGQPTPYTAGTYYNTFSNNVNIGQGNLSGGITAIEIVHSSQGSWQFSVSPAIPKTSSYQLTINYSISWARYP